MLPQPTGVVYIGLTDEEDRHADGHRPAVPEHDIDFLLGVVNTALAVPLTRADVVGTFAGLRPLVRDEHVDGREGTADISRRHLVTDTPGQPITVVGGKLTTYRRMAQDAVDAVAARLGSAEPSRTRSLPLVGAARRKVLKGLDAPARLVRKYGTEAAGRAPARAGRTRCWRSRSSRAPRSRAPSCCSRCARRAPRASTTCWTGAPGWPWCRRTRPGPASGPNASWRSASTGSAGTAATGTRSEGTAK